MKLKLLKNKYVLLIFLPLVFCFFFILKDSDDCREIAFQKSPLYGQSARRHFEITDLNNANPFSLSYLISFKCDPMAEVTTSSFSCDIKRIKEISEEEEPHLIKLIEGCKH